MKKATRTLLSTDLQQLAREALGLTVLCAAIIAGFSLPLLT